MVWNGIYDLNNIQLKTRTIKGIYDQLNTTFYGIYDQLNTTFYGIYDQIYDWQLRLGLYKVSMTNLIQQLTKFMTGMVSMTSII